jgi:hypothetical protein
MSSPQRRKELQTQRDREYEARWKEEARRASLTISERIDEADATSDVKEILHMLAEKLGLES